MDDLEKRALVEDLDALRQENAMLWEYISEIFKYVDNMPQTVDNYYFFLDLKERYFHKLHKM
jgi:hypothetical protein